MKESKEGKPVSEKETTAERKKSEAKTERVKKDLVDEPGKEKFAGSMRNKTGEDDK